MSDEESTALLKCMWEEGKWADLKIKSSDGKIYNVHKAVICERSTFLARVDPKIDLPQANTRQYGIPTLQKEIEWACSHRAGDCYHDDIVRLAREVYDRKLDKRLPPSFLEALTYRTTFFIHEIMADKELWSVLQKHPEYQQAVIKYLAEDSDKVKQR